MISYHCSAAVSYRLNDKNKNKNMMAFNRQTVEKRVEQYRINGFYQR